MLYCEQQHIVADHFSWIKLGNRNFEMLGKLLISALQSNPEGHDLANGLRHYWRSFQCFIYYGGRCGRGKWDSQFLLNIIQFLRKNQMDFVTTPNHIQMESIFLNSPCPGLDLTSPSAIWDFKPYLEGEDSIKYVAQFLDLEEQAPEITQLTSKKPVQEFESIPIESAQRNKERSYKVDKKKKIQKPQNSPFHNYQKHLNNALKKLIIVPEFDSSNDSYKMAASEIWNRYMVLEIKTKRILHYIFNESNEHIINDVELQAYGLWEILQTYGADTFNRAKTFLSKLAIDQIDEENIEGYLKTRKLKRHEGFKEYIIQFRQQLSNGYLKRRVNLQQMQY